MDDFLTHEHSDDYATEFEERQTAIELANRDSIVEKLEKIRANLNEIRAEQPNLIKL